MDTPNYAAAGEVIARHERFAILAHVRPDGDAYGSGFALGLALRAQGKEVHWYNEDGLDPQFTFLPGSGELNVTSNEPPPEGTAIIALDCAKAERLGDAFTAWGRPVDLNIDHHVSNPGYGQVNLIVGSAAATCEILFELIESQGLPCPPEVATCLYVGLCTDTNSFGNRNTNQRSFEVAAELVRRGAEPAYLAQMCFQNYPATRLKLLREALNETVFTAGDRIAYFHLTPETFAKTGASREETEGLIEYLQTTGSIQVAFMLECLEDGKIRVSMRSRGKVDVAKIATELGGGGHKLAAGIRSALPADELIQTLTDRILAQLDG
ncbi:MAG: bifunctional oligoribonuclease/PAP phosphatase NrnA [Verrucomicrobiota bacterium]